MDPNSKDGTVLRKRPHSVRTGRQSGAHGSAEEEAAGAVNSEIIVVEEEPASPLTRLFHQPCLNCYIMGIMGVRKSLDVDVVKSGLEATLVRHPRFSSILVTDEAGGKKGKWVRTEVVVENHIVIPNLEDAGRTTTSPDQLVEDYVASLTRNPMDHSRPLWDLHILNMPTSDAAAVSVLRLHHSLGDGTSLMSLFLACTRKASDPDSLPIIPNHYLRRPPASKRLHAGAFTRLLWLWTFVMLVWNTLVDLIRFTATSIFLKDTPTPLMGSQGVEHRPKRIVHRSVSLDDIKDVKNAMHCTVNDVLVGVTSAGLSRYLSRRYGHTDHCLRLILYELTEDFTQKLSIVAAAALCHRVLSNTTLSLSNMMGPVEQIVFYGHPLVYLALSVFGHPQALTVHFQSYMNTMKIVLTVDEAVIPDPHQLLDDLAESLRLIKTAIPAAS